MSALKIKDAQGNWIEVPMIKGDKGDKGEQGDTYELTEQDKQDIADLVDVPESFEIHICSSEEYDSTTRVPTIQTPDEKTFYLVPSVDGTSPDLFVEWAYVNNAWEMFGSASIDLSNYVTNTDYATSSTGGIVKIGTGIKIGGDGERIYTDPANGTQIKTGTDAYRPLTPFWQSYSTFYGLAKASGDSTQAQSANSVGTYTDEAKTAIKQMLGVVDSYDSLVVNVTGTDPVITAQPSYRYNCGEVTSLTITPPSSGTIDFIFTSGTTPTVLDLPNTVKMPPWWIGVEANTTYEMCITDGVYCGVMSWDV